MINKLIVGPTRSTLNTIKTNLTHMKTCTSLLLHLLLLFHVKVMSSKIIIVGCRANGEC